MIRRLKSLEMQGYKTFATMTRMEFPGQITAIVGPNGSGKSNIADGVRWVLGEQSFSLLRARRTEDMIFSGSQQRSRSGMASTTISFNNEDGWLPIDYSEVAISRRAYRDGQNEYLLNGQKVRLKDISELLSQTGLSERTYTIIGQGLVDVALALKPDERIQLFEEAAGIGLYRSRKEDSLRRLENTRKNLDRILDIMTEIRPRLRSLERQAKRFEEYQQLRADLQVLLLEWYGYHWHQKQQDLRIVSNDYKDQERRLSTLRKKHAEAQLKVEEARQTLRANRNEQEMAHRELSEYHQQLEQTTRQLAIIEERQRSFNLQKSNLEIDITHVEEEIRQLESQEVVYQNEIENRSADFDIAEKEFSHAKDALDEVNDEKSKKDAQLVSVHNSRVSAETEKVQVNARLQELSNRLDSLNNEKTKIESALKQLSVEKENISQTIKSKENSLGEIIERGNLAQKAIEEKEAQIEQLFDDDRKITVELSKHETNQSKLMAQLDVLNQAEAALTGYSEGSKTLIEDSRTGRLPKGIEPLSKYILVDERFEKALSAALGELTDLLVVPSGDQDIVLEYLESKARDRVAVVSLDKLSSEFQRKDLRGEGIYGYANKLIKVDKKFKKLVDILFSDILIVEDTEIAHHVQSELIGTMKAVTLNGLVFHANGVMVSGNNTSGKRIGRTRQKTEMEQDLKSLKKLISDIFLKKEKITENIKKMQEEQNALKNKYHAIDEEINVGKLQLQEAKDNQMRVNEQYSWHKDRLNDIENQIGETKVDINATETQYSKLSETINKLKGEEKLLQDEINTFPLFELQQSLNHWQTNQIVTRNALESAQQRFQDHATRLSDAKRRFETYQNRLAEINKNLDETKSQTITLKDQASQIEASIKDIETTKAMPLSEKVTKYELNLSSLEKLQDHSHKQVIIAERQYTQFELEFSRRKDQLENLREKIEDDFGLVSFDYEQKIDGPTPLPFTDDMVENLPRQDKLSDGLEDEVKRLKSQIHRIGAINPEAQQEYLEVKERHEFLTQQIDDLEKATENLKEVIATLDDLMERDFLKTFKAVDEEFTEYFSKLFNGGEAKLVFIDENNPVEGGVDIIARLPGRRQQGLSLLSGGERSLTAVALVFALLKVSPTPFCILDEVDAMLDESNVGRFIELLRELSKNTQFVIITHNRNTVQAADVIYGVTMGRDSTSQMISLKLEEVDEVYFE